jgi:hypothetical protein
MRTWITAFRAHFDGVRISMVGHFNDSLYSKSSLDVLVM